MKKILCLLILSVTMLCADTLVVDADADCSTGWFGDESCDKGGSCMDGDDYYDDIQDAVDDASNGDIIKICAGNYDESVSIDAGGLFGGRSDITISSGDDVDKPTDVNWTNDDDTLDINESTNMDINLSNIALTSNNEHSIDIGKGKNLILENIVLSAKKEALYGDSDLNGSYTISNSTFDSSDNRGLYFKTGVDININDTNITSQTASIFFDSDVDGNYAFNNLNLNSDNDKGISLAKGKDVNITQTKIISDKASIAFGDSVDGNYSFHNLDLNSSANIGIYIAKGQDIDINDTTIVSKKASIYFDSNVNGNYSFKRLDLNSSTRKGIFISKGKDVVVDDTNITSDNSAIYFDSSVDGNYGFDNLDLNSNGGYGIYVNKGKDINITNMQIVSHSMCVYFKSDVVGAYRFQNIEFNSSDGNGINIKAGANISINDANISSKNSAIFFDKDVSGDYTLSKLNLTSSDHNGIKIKGGNDINISDIYIRSYDSSIFFDDDVNGTYVFKNLDTNSSDKYGIKIRTGQDVTVKDSNITSVNSGIFFDENVSGDYSFSGLDINSSDKRGFYLKGGKDINITESNITSSQTAIYFSDNVDGKYRFKDINISTDGKGIRIKEGSGIDFDTITIVGTGDDDSYYGIYVYKELNGDISIEKSDINVSGYAFFTANNGVLDVNSSKFTTRKSKKAMFIYHDPRDVVVKNSCFYKESTEDDYYSFFLDNHEKKTSKVNNNCFYGTPVKSLGYADATDNDFEGNFWENLTDSSYDYNKVLDDSPLASCPNSCRDGNGSNEINDKNASFDSWDTFRDIDDKNISTKIVSQDFNVTIASLDDNKSDYQEFNGTVCSRIIIENDTNVTGWKKNFFHEENSSNQTDEGDPVFNVTQAIKKSKVEIIWLKDANVSCSDVEGSSDHNETNSTDNFAIRPLAFKIIPPSNQVYAGEDFNISFRAVGDDDKNATDYNESNGSSFDINVVENKSGCVTGTYSGDVTFSDGGNTTVANYSEIGNIDINISDTDILCDDRFASVDCKDKNVTDHWNSDTNTSIGSKDINLSVNPYELNITKLDFTVSTGNDWLYMAHNIKDMNVTLKTTLKAFNKQGDTLKDFNSTCYAKDINVTFYYDINNTNYDVNLTLDGNLTDKTDVNISDINKTLQISKELFTNGEANSSYAFGIDRDYNVSKNPKNVKLKEANITTSGIAKNENNISKDANVTFYYARTYSQDLSTSESSDTTKVSILVYADSDHKDFVSGYKEELLDWYLNKEHNTTFGEINATTPSTSVTKSATTEIKSSISSLTNGVATVEVNTTDSTRGTYFIHLGEDRWLWYVPKDFGNDYNYSDGSDCSQHPCLKYSYEADNHNESGVTSGEYSGVKFDINVSKNSKGVRLLR